MFTPLRMVAPAIYSFSFCLVSAGIGIRCAPFLGLLDVPGGRRQHKVPVPKVGGLALVLALLVPELLLRHHPTFTLVEAGAIFGMAVLGLVDDILDLRARWKAGLGLLAAIVLAIAATHQPGSSPTSFELFGMPIPPAAWIATTLLVLLFWCIPQAINLIDGANGLAVGFGLVVLGSLWAAGAPHPVLAGALLACLGLNWPKARLFLGDCGSLSVGLALVIFAQKVLLLPDANRLLWLFAYPIIDVSMVIAIRLLKHKPVFTGDRNHLHFQLSDRFPALSFLTVPFLLVIAALCSSEIYLGQRWMVVPFSGLAMLLALASYFTLLSCGTLDRLRDWARAFAYANPILADDRTVSAHFDRPTRIQSQGMLNGEQGSHHLAEVNPSLAVQMEKFSGVGR